MINNFWEEKAMSNDINVFHEKLLRKMDIPKWVNLDCPFCKKLLSLSSIRSFGVKFNTRNMGDLFIEVLCTECSKMDTLYFRNQIDTINDFILFLNGQKEPTGEPVIEEKMYAMNYNNVVERMVKRDNKGDKYDAV